MWYDIELYERMRAYPLIRSLYFMKPTIETEVKINAEY